MSVVSPKTLFFLLLAVSAHARESPAPLKGPAREETFSERLAGRERAQVAEAASRYGAKESEIRFLRGRGMGWAEVGRILKTARRARAPFYEIARLREGGMSWGEIVERYQDELLAKGKAPGLSEREALRDAPNQPKPRKESSASDLRTLLDNRDPEEKRRRPLSLEQDPLEGRKQRPDECGSLPDLSNF